MVNILTFQTLFCLFSNKMLVIRVVFHKMLIRIANREEPDLGLPCLFKPFWQATSVRNF